MNKIKCEKCEGEYTPRGMMVHACRPVKKTRYRESVLACPKCGSQGPFNVDMEFHAGMNTDRALEGSPITCSCGATGRYKDWLTRKG